MSHLRKRADQVLKKVPMGQLLVKLGFAIDPNSNREQQFSCGLHGQDTKRSARFFPTTNSTYCWTCHKPRDVIDYVREMEGVGFGEAISILESMFSLEKVPWEEENLQPSPDILDEIREEDLEQTLSKILSWMTRDKVFKLEEALRYWEAFDIILELEDKLKRKKLSQMRVSLNHVLAKRNSVRS